jgi:hypothetical protein
MDKKQAAEQIRTLFESSFNRDNFIHFINNLLNNVELRDNHYTGNYIPDAFKQHINQYWRIGKYTDPKQTELDVYIVEVKSLSKLDRARTALRNFIVRTLHTFGDKDHALIAFYAKEDNGTDWRFSYVKIEHSAKQDGKTGKVKLEKELTPAKRYSFLVGKHEKSHTAQSQLVDLLAMDYVNPAVAEIEKAFSIEKVTKEFFEQYKELFVHLSEVLAEQAYFQKERDGEKRKQNVAKFAKKLLGQIVFLYFLQKKGWLGVKEGEAWGKGERRFLQKLFSEADCAGQNYYAEKLQFLFYDALANDRKDQFDPSYYKPFDCKIPFLNGGLFEPDYDWQKITVDIPNSIFSNDEKNKADDYGPGIFDVFDRYNFTIKEDEPLEKEVAVDPEMLGKVFENMLEITERKSKGAFYTPREIVHYMCQESLIHYLDNEVGSETEVGIPKENIEFLIRKGHLFVENDEAALQALQRIGHGEQKTTKQKTELPESVQANASLLDRALSNIKICDPAIGSGAFPVGMLNEVVQARQALATYLPGNHRLSPYELKKHTIANSIYGVDIDPSAIDIARLRLWLSLVVDEDNYTTIDALPNLDYKIMQGNSLIEEYEGVKLFDDAFIQKENDSLEREKAALKQKQSVVQANFFAARNAGKKEQEAEYEVRLNEILKAIQRIERQEKKLAKEKAAQAAGLFDLIGEARKKASQLEGLHQKFFTVSSPAEKRQLRDEITTLEWELIEATLAEQSKTDALAKLLEYRTAGEKPWFLWKLNFSEVFKQKGGFDIVIGNPPYLRIQGIREHSPETADAYKKIYQSATGSFDLYVLFMERGAELVCDSGILNFINPDKWVNSSFGKGIRKLVAKNKNVQRLISFGAHQVFEASTYSSLVWIGKQKLDALDYVKVEPNTVETTLEAELGKLNTNAFTPNNYDCITDEPWILVSGKSAKVMKALQKSTVSISDFLKIFVGLQTSKDSVYFLKKAELKNGIYEADSPELGKRVSIEETLVKPLLLGDQVHRYQPIKTDNIVIFPYILNGDGKPALMAEEYIAENFPRGYAYLKECENILRGRERGRFDDSDWFQFGRKQGIAFGKYPKLLAPDISLGGNFSYDPNGDFYTTTTLYGYLKKNEVTESYEFWMALLNSSLLWFYLKNSGSVLANGYYRYKPAYLENFPVPVISESAEKHLSQLAIYILHLNGQNVKNLLTVKFIEQLIDGLVYELYFPDELKTAGKEIFPHLGELTPITDGMSDAEKLAIIQREFDRLYDPRHPVRNIVETLDSVEVVRTIREALKR